jgi:hypothetical protein
MNSEKSDHDALRRSMLLVGAAAAGVAFAGGASAQKRRRILRSQGAKAPGIFESGKDQSDECLFLGRQR